MYLKSQLQTVSPFALTPMCYKLFTHVRLIYIDILHVWKKPAIVQLTKQIYKD